MKVSLIQQLLMYQVVLSIRWENPTRLEGLKVQARSILIARSSLSASQLLRLLLVELSLDQLLRHI